MSGLSLDRYLPRESPIHALDARVKFVVTIAFILAVSLLPVGSFAAIGIAWGAVAILSGTAKLGPFRPARNAFFALPFVLAALPLVFTRPGEELLTLPFGLFTLRATLEGLIAFLTIALKSWVAVQAALLLAYTTPFHDLIDALRALRVPGIFVTTVSFMYRYLAVLSDEASRMLRARAARSGSRGGRSGGTLRWRATVAGRIVGALFIRAYERSERVYQAMLARGFEGTIRPRAARALHRAEWGALAIAVLLLAAFETAAHLWIPAA